ncbi:unnamed protein product [Schistosoma mattheei]|uniref:Uncharacterized protein n=1 Tax=Schistosoma mattheei TaxID=31246 RepID=A0A183PM70_9TREM|nr:unnamed protein product [Schistosoma mattheei]
MLSCSSLARSADVRYLINLCRSSAVSSEQLSAFKPKTALILAKLSKYDCEKSMETYLNDDQLKTSIERRGFNPRLLIARHETHYAKLFELKNALRNSSQLSPLFLDFGAGVNLLLGQRPFDFEHADDILFLCDDTQIMQIKPSFGTYYP